MSVVRDFYHVEIDNIGKGKRVRQPPGGESSDIFGTANGEVEHQTPSPHVVKNLMQSRIFSQDGDITPSPQSRRQNQSGDSQSRLFGPPEEDNSPRKIVDRLKSNIFSEEESLNETPNSKKNDSEDQTDDDKQTTPEKVPVRTRIPPGGVSSGIF
ncbi:microtubule-associated protein Jupiter-like [Limulus polyphemus]|uniref:Microtubule-associated protein Jupiter n=1 Tax=Limulus polyphemus TaxID=6850 RepID=A0ABM1BWC4_LIMPO|nr:microtubule-associated protein Jupiter-like [Limulus polyphemus]